MALSLPWGRSALCHLLVRSDHWGLMGLTDPLPLWALSDHSAQCLLLVPMDPLLPSLLRDQRDP